jgi:hypothetical protein
MAMAGNGIVLELTTGRTTSPNSIAGRKAPRQTTLSQSIWIRTNIINGEGLSAQSCTARRSQEEVIVFLVRRLGV